MILSPKIKNLSLVDLIKRLGVVGTAALFTALTAAMAVSSTGIINLIFFGECHISNYFGAVVSSFFLAPIFLIGFVKLLFEIFHNEEMISKLVTSDVLTGAFNRRFFMKTLEREFLRAKQYKDMFSLAILDIDDFKRINDTYGHQPGDQVLQALSEVCKNNTRVVDTFARYGGEEFVVLLPSTNAQGAEVCLERIREKISQTPVVYESQTIHFTVSCGIKEYADEDVDLDAVLQQTDEALYAAKAAGKNRVCIYAKGQQKENQT